MYGLLIDAFAFVFVIDAESAVLLPTVSDVPRDTKEKITEYFTNFCKLEPQGVILESFVTIGTNWAKDCGM